MGTNTITYQKTSDTPDVAFYSVPAANSGNSGDEEVIVGNVHFSWESAEGGFTNTGWWGTEVLNGPTRIGNFTNDDDVTQHLKQPGATLTEAFRAWQIYINGLDVWEQNGVVDDFCQAPLLAGNGNGRNCMS